MTTNSTTPDRIDRTGTRTYVSDGMTDIEITYPGDALHPVYHRYERQTDAQDAYIELDAESGHLMADWCGEIGPCRHIDDDLHRWGIEPQIPREMLCDLLDAIAPLAARLCDGEEAADDEIADICERYADSVACSGDPGVIEAIDWLEGQSDAALGITAATTDRELIDIATRIEADAALERVTVWGVDRELEARRDALLEALIADDHDDDYVDEIA